MKKLPAIPDLQLTLSPATPDLIELHFDYLFSVAGDREPAVWALDEESRFSLYRNRVATSDPLLNSLLANAKANKYPDYKGNGSLTKSLLVVLDHPITIKGEDSDCWLIKKPVGKFEWIALPSLNHQQETTVAQSAAPVDISASGEAATVAPTSHVGESYERGSSAL